MNAPFPIRPVLWCAAGFNLGGAFLFACPGTALGQLAGLPAEVPLTYRVMVTLFVLLFGGSYAWLAMQAAINRPLLAFGAIGKSLAFVAFLLLWIGSELPSVSIAVISGDLLLAAAFAHWLIQTRSV